MPRARHDIQKSLGDEAWSRVMVAESFIEGGWEGAGALQKEQRRSI